MMGFRSLKGSLFFKELIIMINWWKSRKS